MLILISAVFMLVFALLGWLLYCGHVEPMMNEMFAPAKKGEVDKEALGKYMGRLMFALAGCVGAFVLGILLHAPALQIIGLLLFVLLFAFGMVYPNLSGKFNK